MSIKGFTVKDLVLKDVASIRSVKGFTIQDLVLKYVASIMRVQYRP